MRNSAGYVERVFSRLKTYRKLDPLRVRRIPKVWLHVAMSLLVTIAVALANVERDVSSIRKAFAVA